MQETWKTWIRSLCQEDLLEKEMATHPSILPWRIPWTELPGYGAKGCKELDMTERLNMNDDLNGNCLILAKQRIQFFFLKKVEI